MKEEKSVRSNRQHGQKTLKKMTPVRTAAMREEFAANGYVALGTIFTDEKFAAVKNEIGRLESYAANMNFLMEEYATPRKMTTLSGKQIKENSEFLMQLYCDVEIRELIAAVAGREVHDCHDPKEFAVATWLREPTATHGWHVDDPPLAIIFFVESPPPDAGGKLEFVSNWYKQFPETFGKEFVDVNPFVEEARRHGLVQEKWHAAGEAYLLRADANLHRVAPLKQHGVRRAIINFAFELEAGIYRVSSTANKLFI